MNDTTPETHDTRNGRSKWRKVLLIALGIVVVICAIAAALVIVYWPKLSAMYRETATVFSELIQVQVAVQREYKAERVKASAAFGQTRGLTFNVVNPPFWKRIEDNPNAPESTEQALKIAVVARDALRNPNGYSDYQVVFTWQREVGISLSKSHVYTFQASELPRSSPDKH